MNVLELLDGLKERGLLDRTTTVFAGGDSVTLAGPQPETRPPTEAELKKREELEQMLRDDLQYGSADV